MTGASIIRVLALLALAGLFVSDFGMGLWAKEVGQEVYVALLAVALGVDVEWFRDVLKSVITRSIGGEKRE